MSTPARKGAVSSSYPRQHHRPVVEQLEARLAFAAELLQQILEPIAPPVVGNTTTNAAPTISNAPRLTSGNVVTGRTTSVSVMGADDRGESNLRYTWQAVSQPASNAVTFAVNGTNAAKNNVLTFKQAGNYALRVGITDQSGSTTYSTLQVRVAQTASSLQFRLSDGRIANSGSTLTVNSNRIRLTPQVLDQFGVVMSPTTPASWVTTQRPANSSVTISPNGSDTNISVTQTGSYGFRAQSGNLIANVNFNVTPSLTSITFRNADGAIFTPSQVQTVTSTQSKVTLQALDQFSKSIPVTGMTATTVAAPSGGSASVRFDSSSATFSFTRAGRYQIRLQTTGYATTLTFNVVQTASRLVVIDSAGRTMNSSVVSTVTGTTQNITGQVLDQFGQSMTTQPRVVWSLASGPAATLAPTGNELRVTYSQAGQHTLRATAGSLNVSLSTNVVATLSRLSVSPGTLALNSGQTQTFRVTALDQFGRSMTTPSVSWSATGGTINASGLYTAGTQSGSFAVTARSGSVSGTATIAVTAPEKQTSLLDDALATLVESFYADQVIDRSEMITALRSAGDDGTVSAAELADFRFLVSADSTYKMPEYVRELAKDVVNENPANLKYRGETAGNLIAGSLGSLLNILVDKWFMGTDLPELTDSSLAYRNATGNLFNGAPSRNDAKQGMLGDCYFIASLISIADENPDTIRDMFIDNEDGTYTIRFYGGQMGFHLSGGTYTAGFTSGQGSVDYVTVNRMLPSFSNQTLAYSGMGQSLSSSSTTLWIALAEKAYAQWNETRNAGRDGTNRYSAIEGGWMSDVNAQVLGKNSTNHDLASANKQTLVNAITSNQAVTFGTKSSVTNEFVGSHAYVITGYDANTDRFSVFNPWGTQHPSPQTWAQLQASGTVFVVTDTTGTASGNGTIVRSHIVSHSIESVDSNDRDLYDLMLTDLGLRVAGSTPLNAGDEETDVNVVDALPTDSQTPTDAFAISQTPGVQTPGVQSSGQPLEGDDIESAATRNEDSIESSFAAIDQLMAELALIS